MAVERRVAASTQTQALNALVFLYDSVLQKPLGELAGLKRIQRRHRVPVVLSREEVKAVLEQMTGVPRLMAELMYGAGLRVGECVTLRVKDIDFSSGALNIRDGKGGKDRTTLLPLLLHAPLNQHLLRVAELHKRDLSHGAGLAPMPSALARKYPSASSLPSGGSLSFRPRCCVPGVKVGAWPAGIPRIRPYSGHFGTRRTGPGFTNTPASIRSDIRSQRTCWHQGRISARSSYCSATEVCRRP